MSKCPVCGRARESAAVCACGYDFVTGRGGASESTRKLAFRSGVALLCVSIFVPAALGVLAALQKTDRTAHPTGLGVTLVLTAVYCLAGVVVGIILIRKGRRA
ncbi:MAG TPA: hypothetical protein VFA28_14375 [Bryobacteraceae bacterium]|jgi:hypothetical protein|nr:hypothetical protein [Bryobacteraceae bacterium]